jgi:hypothetical protein
LNKYLIKYKKGKDVVSQFDLSVNNPMGEAVQKLDVREAIVMTKKPLSRISRRLLKKTFIIVKLKGDTI